MMNGYSSLTMPVGALAVALSLCVWQAPASLKGEMMSKPHLCSTLIFCVLVLSAAPVASDSLDEYIQIFTDGNSQQQTQAAKDLAWAGLSDPRLFDLIEQSLLEKYLTVENKYAVDDTAWLARA